MTKNSRLRALLGSAIVTTALFGATAANAWGNINAFTTTHHFFSFWGNINAFFSL